MTVFSFTQGTAAVTTSSPSLPVHLLALNKAAQVPASNDETLRSAIVGIANYYLRMAQRKTPAEMEAMIWQKTSTDGVDHGESCAAFASLTLELGAQAVGLESWVTGGGTYPWPLHEWADVRVDPNPASLNIVSVLSDAQAHHRWHPLGDGYQPQPGDWVMFDGHVEVVTNYTAGVLSSVGADSLPNLTVNAHQVSGPLGDQGVTGFIDNGGLARPASAPRGSQADASTAQGGQQAAGLAAVPGVLTASQLSQGADAAGPGAAAIPAASLTAPSPPAPAPAPRYGRHQNSPATVPVPETTAQQAFINQVTPGAIAAQRKYGIPAAVTIAQAIDESGWGQSELAVRDHNLFGIKGTGPAGSDSRPTQEYENGAWVTRTASFRVYHNVAESIADHSRLLATSDYYQQAMADREVPDAFAADLTGVYATDPDYGTQLIALMRLYDLYRYDTVTTPAVPHVTPHAAPAPAPSPALPGGAAIPGVTDASTAVPATSTAVPATSTAVPATSTAVLANRTAAARTRTFTTRRYVPQIPRSVMNAFVTDAKAPLSLGEPLYRDVARSAGISWQLLAACDWMQCKAHPRFSPVHGEKLATVNVDGTVYRTKSAALTRCARDLVELAGAVYRIDLTADEDLGVPDLAKVFAAFRWGGLLKAHAVSALEFPYSVAGLTPRHLKMHWPDISEPNAPDKPGSRFRMTFGAVPIALSLGYQPVVSVV